MKNLKTIVFALFILPTLVFSQAIEIVSYGENPLEVSPLLGSNLTINYKYTSEAGSTGNHLFIGLEILDANNDYVSYINGKTLENQTAGENNEGSVSFFVGSSNKLSADLPAGHYYQAKAVLFASGGWTENAWAGNWNTPALTLQDTSNFKFSTNTLAKGADVSWMTEMESNGFTWKDNDGNTKELLPLLKEYNLDAVRLRVWVNPENSAANGWCDINDLVKKADSAKAQNMDIMICIHYSDHWADPGKQTKPAAWSGYSVAQLETAVANHTTAILTALKAEGIKPKWVQVGNETNDGILWTTGKASTGGFANYAKFINAGITAVKNFDTTIKTILHIASGNNNDLFRWNIDGLTNNGLNSSKLDIVGMSLYPDATNWKMMVDNTYNNMLDVKARYGKDVMMAEIGFNSSQPSISHQFLTYMIEKTKQAKGVGVFYWEPIAHKNWNSYNKGAWDADGSPSITMDAFINKATLSVTKNNKHSQIRVYPNPSSNSIHIALKEKTIQKIEIFDVTGKSIFSKVGDKNTETIHVESLVNGIYFIKINNLSVVKFIKN